MDFDYFLWHFSEDLKLINKCLPKLFFLEIKKNLQDSQPFVYDYLILNVFKF